MQFVTRKTKAGALRKQRLERTFGARCGVRNAPKKVAAFESCQHREILNCMPVTSAATFTVVPTPNQE